MLDLKGKKIAIFGMGRSGLAALKLCHIKGAEVFAINNGAPADWTNYKTIKDLINDDNCYEESKASKCFENSDLIILSPGIPDTHPILKAAKQKQVPIWSEIELANQFYDGPLIAVTGTNGKTTTVSLIGDILKNSNLNVFVGGNIGIPYCELILSKKDVDVVVLELSSFQLETTYTLKPDVAMILNIYPNHGERYESHEDYAKAKFRITMNMDQDTFFIYPQDQDIISNWVKTQNISKINFSINDSSNIRDKISETYDLSNLKLVGKHNLLNIFCAIEAVKSIGLDHSGIQESLNNFPGIIHRLQYVECDEGFKVFNDAKSTNWDATLTAVDSLDELNEDLYLILGGQKRGRGDSILPYLDRLSKKVKKIFLIGDMAEALKDEIKDKIPYQCTLTLDATIDAIRAESFDGILLLSPAFPSFDQFSNYQMRGEYFLNLLNEKS